MPAAAFEISLVTKAGGPLTKRIWLDDSGHLNSDGSQCVMTAGRASRLSLSDLGDLADAIGHFEPKHAITLGRLRPGLADDVAIVTQRRANGNGSVARTKKNFVYEPGRTALALLDYDAKGMPPDVADRLASLGGFDAAVASVLHAISGAGRLKRASTSAGLYRSDTGERFASSGGLHLYLAIRDGADAGRFLKTLHARLVLAGLGWLMIGAGGQLLERSIVDRVVGSPERLVFEGPPVIVPPVEQDAEARRPIAVDGGMLDTIVACPPLSIVEDAEYRAARAKMAAALNPEIAAARAKFVKEQSERIAARRGISAAQATRIVERQCCGVLLPGFELPFDDPELAGNTVADVLADPYKFDGETLADPLEGVTYGRCKAKIMRRTDGTIWINSFAHGRTIYELKLDYAAVEKVLLAVLPDDAAETFVQLVLAADLTAAEIERLREIVSRRGIGKRTLAAMLKSARREAAAAAAQQRREQQLAGRQDPRPPVPAPLPDAEWLPIVDLLNTAHARSTADEPPMRDRNGDLAQIRTGLAPSLHMLTNDGSTQLPAPPPALIAKLSEPEAAELIERHVEFQEETADGYRSVHLAPSFVRHFMNRSDAALPIVTGISSLPIVLPNEQLLSGSGLDRRSGVVFRIPAELRLPNPGQCDDAAVAKAMDFLVNQWLVDVATDYTGKCILIACALTIIERMALPERPAFFVTAGQRGGGKTTALHMVSVGVLGARAAAAAWSPNDEERRKALFAYLGAGLPFLVWDNIPLGSAISCPSIEKALTAEVYSDRVLGESRHMEVPAYTIQAFTGNNVTARGDLASRSLSARLSVDRTDPENREFVHPDPIGWTERRRAEILAALFTILLGNPRFREFNAKPAETRFKAWWHLVGAAIENAASQQQQRMRFVGDPPTCPAIQVRFRDLFLDGETDDEMGNALANVLETLRARYPGMTAFQASDVAVFAGAADYSAINFKAALELASGKGLPIISSQAVSARLRAIKDRPTKVGKQLLALRYQTDHQGGAFCIKELPQ